MEELLEKYRKSWAYQELLKKHKLSTKGIWQVLGEDSNCDLTGPHVQPTLGYYVGVLEDVIRHAVTMERFWQWGSGGDFKLIEVKKIPER